MQDANVRIIHMNNLNEAMQEIKLIGSDDMGIKLMTPKGVFRVLKLEGISFKIANIIKQEMLSKGGEAAVSREAAIPGEDKTDMLLMGTIKQYREVMKKLKLQPFRLPKLADEIKLVLDNLENNGPRQLVCRNFSLPLKERTLVMGILNFTPDSFSDGGRFYDFGIALEHAHRMVEEGADIIDVGGETTKPTATPLSQEEELKRVIPIVERLAKEIKVPISVDTYKAEVARQSLEAGAHIINDVWGLQADPQMAKVAAAYPDVPLIMMHNQKGTEYSDLMGDMLTFLRNSCNQALEAGVRPENIFIDPGIGFGKTLDQNLEVMKRLRELHSLGYPILLGTSRKSMIGNTLNLPMDQRVEGTAATVALGITYGVDIVRVHDVKEMVRVARMTDAMVRR